jgi:hypothetical protein
MSISIFPVYFCETLRSYQNVLRHFHPSIDISCPFVGVFRSAANFDAGRLREYSSVMHAGAVSAAWLE